MRRLPLLDTVLLAVLLPVWLAAAALHVRQVAGGRLAWVGVYVTAPESPDAYPTVSGFWPGVDPDSSELAPGDRLLRLDDIDLGGVGPIRLFALAHERLAEALERGTSGPRVTYRRNGPEEETLLPFVPVRFPWRLLPVTAGLVGAATLVLLRRPGAWVARRFFLACTAFALHWTWFFGGAAVVTYAWIATFFVASTVVFPLILLESALFPPEVAGARAPLWPWAFAIFGPVALTAAVGTPFPPALGLPGMYAINVGTIVAVLAVLTRNYARAAPRGRRQLKWKIYGYYLALAPVLVANFVTLYEPELWWLHDLAAIAEVAAPVCLLIAITQDHLFDIDRLITATVAYSILSAILLATVLIVVPPIADAASTPLGIDRSLGSALLSAGIAVLLLVAYRLLAPRLERVLFRERSALQEGVNALLAAIATAPDEKSVVALVGARLAELVLPTSCSIYELDASGDRFIATVSIGRGIPAEPPLEISARGPLAALASRAETPIALQDASALPVADVSEAAHVSTLSPAVLAPLRLGGDLRALLLLGAKRSGDVYSGGDLAILAAVVDRASARLEQIDREKRTATGALVVPRKFELIGKLGQGGMGIVLKARHRSLDTTVALKILPDHLASDEEFVSRFHHEARVMAQLNHPNIVRVLDIDSEGALHYFVMEYVAGQSLADRLRERGPLSLAETVRIARQLGAALDYAHTRTPPVVHRDVSPSNVLLEEATGRVVVTDFGIARVLGDLEARMTQTGGFLGKARYAAPEHLRGDRDLDTRADVYSFGMVLYEMFAGQAYFAGIDEYEVMRHVLHASEPQSLDFGRVAPERFRAIVTRAIQRNRERRYRTIRELLGDLAGLADGHDPAAVAAEPPRSPSARAGDGSATLVVAPGAVTKPPKKVDP